VQAVMADGRVVRMFGTVQDVTDRVERERALRESARRARELAEGNESLRAEIEVFRVEAEVYGFNAAALATFAPAGLPVRACAARLRAPRRPA
jgi:hypothetical protein